MKYKKLLITGIIVLCGVGIMKFGVYLYTESQPKFVAIDVDGADAQHYKLKDYIDLDEVSITILSLEDIGNQDVRVITDIESTQVRKFTSYYSIFYGINDRLIKESGSRIENNEIILNYTKEMEYTQLMIMQHRNNEIVAVIDL